MLWRCDLRPQAEKYREKLISLTGSVLSSGRYILAKEVEKFEKAFASYCGARYCAGVGSGTDALVLSLKAIGLENGAEVITTPFTAIPTISAIVSAGGRPVFADIDPDTFLIDMKEVKARLTGRTAAVIPVHLFTQMVDVKSMRSLLPGTVKIIEDAAQAHGCRFDGMMAGAHGDLAAYSFYPTKNLGGYGDGGAIITNYANYAGKVRLLHNYGKESADRVVLNGVNSRLDELQAAFLRLKLADLEAMNEARRKIADIYREDITGLPVLHPKIQKGAIPNYHLYVVKVLERRDELKSYLYERSVQTDVFYPQPHHLQPVYKDMGYKAGDFKSAEKVGSQVLALPIYPELQEEKARHISKLIKAFFGD